MNGQSLFSRLRENARDDWNAYVEHPFIQGLQDGSLPASAFRHYLVQDYLFLIHFARAHALAGYKAERLDDIRAATEAVRVITEIEMGLHIEYCKSWGLDEEKLLTTPEAPENMAYTRFVLECGHAGDLLDLHVALLPCMWGYAEIGERLANDPATKRGGNPYLPWIGMYSSADYLKGARASLAMLDRLYDERAGEGRMASLVRTFRQATRLETRFWQMGLDAAD